MIWPWNLNSMSQMKFQKRCSSYIFNFLHHLLGLSMVHFLINRGHCHLHKNSHMIFHACTVSSHPSRPSVHNPHDVQSRKPTQSHGPYYRASALICILLLFWIIMLDITSKIPKIVLVSSCSPRHLSGSLCSQFCFEINWEEE